MDHGQRKISRGTSYAFKTVSNYASNRAFTIIGHAENTEVATVCFYCTSVDESFHIGIPVVPVYPSSTASMTRVIPFSYK